MVQGSTCGALSFHVSVVRRSRAKEAEEAFAKMKLKEAAEGVVMTWVYEKGQIHRKPGGIPPKPGKRPGDHPTCRWPSRR